MEGWKKLVAGALIGVAGTVYATDEEARRNLPRSARDLPDNIRRRFRGAVSAGRDASSRRRQEILTDLEGHGGGAGVNHRPRRDGVEPEPSPEASTASADLADDPQAPELPLDDATEPINSGDAAAQRGTAEGD